MIAESKAAHSENVQAGKTNLVSGEDKHPIFSGFSLSDLPIIDGYHAMTSRSDEGAEDILLSANHRDPILSARQVGLGRVITWMSDIGEDWARDWQVWPRQGDFWINVIRYAIPDPTLDPAQVDISVSESEVIVNLQILSSAGVPINLADPQFSYVNHEGNVISYALFQISPGKYKLSFPHPPSGAYRGVIRYGGLSENNEIAAPFVVDYPKEWQPVTFSSGMINLNRWAAMTNGKQIDLKEEISNSVLESERGSDLDTSMLLLVILVISWPLEIAVRRRWMPWQ
jgi:hypothetical protein